MHLLFWPICLIHLIRLKVTQDVMIMIFYLTETHRSGIYTSGSVLFISNTGNVNVRFTSDYFLTFSGFKLEVRGINCASRAWYHENFPVAERVNLTKGSVPCGLPELIEISQGEVRRGAIAMETGQ